MFLFLFSFPHFCALLSLFKFDSIQVDEGKEEKRPLFLRLLFTLPCLLAAIYALLVVVLVLVSLGCCRFKEDQHEEKRRRSVVAFQFDFQ